MAANFLHGVETIEVQQGTRPINAVKTAVVGLVGTAPIWGVAAENRTVNRPVLITSPADAARYFGPDVNGYTIPAALKAIFDQGAGIVIAVNVFDPETDKVPAIRSTMFRSALGGHTALLPDRGVQNLELKSDDGAITYQLNVDYRADLAAGKLTRIPTGAIPLDVGLFAHYERPDLTKVTAAEIVGAVAADGTRTGMRALATAGSRFGFTPRLLIAPAYCTQASVAAELEVLAESLRAIALIDAPIGTTVVNAIAGRGPGGSLNFGSSSDRVVLCYPHLRVVGPTGERLEPYSQRLAGVIASRDMERGYHWSPSNMVIVGVTGIERALTGAVNDPTSEVNLLNEVGITTVFNGFGTGIRSWGNRSAAFPADTGPTNLISVRRTADVVHESIEHAMLQFLDMPINDALVDSISETVNAFLRTLMARGALIDGRCTFDPANNTPVEMAAGRLRFNVAFMPPAPAERISFDSVVDVRMLVGVGTGASGGLGGDE